MHPLDTPQRHVELSLQASPRPKHTDASAAPSFEPDPTSAGGDASGTGDDESMSPTATSSAPESEDAASSRAASELAASGTADDPDEELQAGPAARRDAARSTHWGEVGTL